MELFAFLGDSNSIYVLRKFNCLQLVQELQIHLGISDERGRYVIDLQKIADKFQDPDELFEYNKNS